MRIARVNIYLPDDLAEKARAAGLNVSGLTQEALRRALRAERIDQWLEEVTSLPPTRIDGDVVTAAVASAKDDLEAERGRATGG